MNIGQNMKYSGLELQQRTDVHEQKSLTPVGLRPPGINQSKILLIYQPKKCLLFLGRYNIKIWHLYETSITTLIFFSCLSPL